MFTWFRRRRELHRNAQDLYGSIMALSRQPHLFAEFGLPDSVEGRFEVLTAHMFLFLERLRAEGEKGESLSQALVDEFFRDMDITNRQLGVGDLSVPKKMRHLAAIFAARLEGYRKAFETGDSAPLEARVAEYTGLVAGQRAPRLFAGYMRQMSKRLGENRIEELHNISGLDAEAARDVAEGAA